MIKNCLSVLVLLTAFALGQAVASELQLGPGDRVRVEVFGRPDLSIEQDIDASGAVRVPLAGRIEVADRPVEDVEKAISDALAGGGIEASPSVLVTVVKWRPVYVLGDVRSPQAVDYTPDLTVLKAVTLAGGFGLAGDGELSRLDVARSRERLETAYNTYRQLEIRKARLIAERDGLEQVSVPKGADDGTPATTALVDTESRLFQTRQQNRAARLASLARLEGTYRDELEALETQRDTMHEELKIAAADVEASRALSEKGLELRSRNSLVQRSRLEILGRIAETTALISRASANLEETQQKRQAEPVARQEEILAELAEVQAEIMKAKETIRSESAILGEVGRDGDGSRQVTIEIVRDTRREQASETTALQPGDVVEITLRRPALLDEEQAVPAVGQ